MIDRGIEVLVAHLTHLNLLFLIVLLVQARLRGTKVSADCFSLVKWTVCVRSYRNLIDLLLRSLRHRHKLGLD